MSVSELFNNDSVEKQILIVTDDGTVRITNTELHNEKMELQESLCSEKELQFGSCEASVLKFTISNVFLSTKGKWLAVSMTLAGKEVYPLGRYKVYSDVPTADRSCRDIVAYDALYDIVNADVSAWYNGLSFPMTLRQFRDSFFQYIGIAQAETILINDDLMLGKTLSVTTGSADGSVIGETLSGKTVLSCICEVNGCFGHMGRDGKFHYVVLEQEIRGLYPADNLYPANNLFPRDEKSILIDRSEYLSATYEDYTVHTIDKLQIRTKENDIGVIVGSGNNAYIIEGNFLLYGLDADVLQQVAGRILAKIKDVVYTPYKAECKGNPTLEVGSGIRFHTAYALIESYIFTRTLKGVQALRDSIGAEGEEYRSQKVNSVHQDILQLKGKSNELVRTIDETRSTIAEVNGKYSEIQQTVDEIKTEIGDETTGMKSQIIQQAAQIAMKVGNNEVRSKFAMDPTSVSIESGTISFKASTLEIESTNFKLDKSGNATFSGTVTGAEVKSTKISGGTITGTDITGGTLYITGRNMDDPPAKEAVYISGETDKGKKTQTTYATYLAPGGARSEGPTHYTAMGHNAMGVHSRDGSFYAELNHKGVATGGGLLIGGSAEINGSLTVKGVKNRRISTANYNDRLQYCYETTSPMFGDIGEGKTDETGKCLVWLDDVFAETIDTGISYQVFLQAYGEGTVYVSERSPTGFVVCGTPGLQFGWEVKAVQRDFDAVRLEEYHREEAPDLSLSEVIGYLDTEVGTVDSITETTQYLSAYLYDTEKESEDIAT